MTASRPEPQPVNGEEFRAQLRKALSARAKAKRNQRGRRPRPGITGIRVLPPRARG